MKNLITTSALFLFLLIASSASAQELIEIDNSNVTGKTLLLSKDFITCNKGKITNPKIYLSINWIDKTGTPSELSKEVKLRNELINTWKMEKYSFYKIVDNPAGQKPGRYILMLK